MTPRFSILVMLLTTAYMAVNLAATTQPDSLFPEIASYSTAGIIVYLLMVACGPTNESSVIARATVLGFVVFPELRTGEPGYWDSSRLQLMNWYWWYRAEYFDYATDDVLDTVVERGNKFAFGVVCACLALWYYRRKTKRKSQSSQ